MLQEVFQEKENILAIKFVKVFLCNVFESIMCFNSKPIKITCSSHDVAVFQWITSCNKKCYSHKKVLQPQMY